MNDMPNVGNILDENDPEPPIGTIVELADGERWGRLDEPGEWHWAPEHQDYAVGVWRWCRVTFEGPVVVVAVPEGATP